jgi:CheY-like chemotaxis protein
LRRVLAHLTGNAVKFTTTGSVQVTARTEGSELRFEITDTGIGIAEADIPALFQPLEQLDSSDSRQYGGSGLGLSVSKRLVEILGGSIGVSSQLTQGSTFWFTIPLVVEFEAPVADPATTTQVAVEDNRQVLVVEDNKINQRVAVRLLQKLGYSTDVAENGKEAVERYEPGRYAAILMDCQMPVMDGFEATRQIRSRESGTAHTPIIAFTARALPEDEQLCRAAGMDDYLRKPVDLMMLSIALRRCAASEMGVAEQRP